ncbi:MAG: hypothetical protein IBX45_06565 [Campylobacterales bacterium]|nr:hypothetical protein [Campylobacterales bacterium]
MKHILTFLSLTLFYAHTLYADGPASWRTYPTDAVQPIFNIAKTLFRQSSPDYLITTRWETLEIQKRTIAGFYNLDVSVERYKFHVHEGEKPDTVTISLHIYTERDEVYSYLSADHFLHALVWNRIDVALGTSQEWIDCKAFSVEKIWHHRNFLCALTPEKLSLLP